MTLSSSSDRSWKLILSVTFAALLHLADALGHFVEPPLTFEGNASTDCCGRLIASLGPIVATSQTETYNNSISSYWAVQAQEVTPWCVVSPRTTLQVSQTVRLLGSLNNSTLNCPFAIRSGGHTPWAGAASIKNGVQIDLRGIHKVQLSHDRNTTSVGPGANWLDVYSKLDRHNLTVTGGRVASVGVGGLVTGGGISFFSPRKGFAVDNVVNYVVVLADGSIVNANATSRPDLFFALKGGSNNFGIVTRFDFKTFSAGNFWGGTIINSYAARNESLAAFVKFAGQKNYDENGSLLHTHTWNKLTDMIIVNNVHYTQPTANPAVFKNFTDIKPQVVQTLRISNMSDFVTEISSLSPENQNQVFYTSTWRNDLELLTEVAGLSEQHVRTVANVEGLVWSLTFQPLVTAITTKSAATGGNALGLDAQDGNLVIGQITASWVKKADDEAVVAAVTNFFKDADQVAASRGLLNPFQYLNYAYKTQDPIKGYGPANVEKLKAASKKYDPTGVFQKQVPGGWKLHIDE